MSLSVFRLGEGGTIMPITIPNINIPQTMLPYVWIGAGSGLVVLLIFILVWWSIFAKAGYSGARSLLLFIPLVNIIIFLIFAFGEWPIQRDLDQLQDENAMLRQQLAMLQQGAQFGSHPNLMGPNSYPTIPDPSFDPRNPQRYPYQ